MNNSLKRAALTLFTAFALGACSQSSGPGNGYSSVKFESEFTGSQVVTAAHKDGSYQTMSSRGETVDSLHVTRARVLVSRLKLHSEFIDDHCGCDKDDDDGEKEEREIKIGPFLLVVEAGKNIVIADGTIPPGRYSKVKFEIHRFTPPEISMYLNDLIYQDFVTGERYTVIVEGTLWRNGQAIPFEFKSDVTANLTLHFPETIDLIDGSTIIAVQINPELIFKHGGFVLDPRDPRNAHDVDMGIRMAVRCFRR